MTSSFRTSQGAVVVLAFCLAPAIVAEGVCLAAADGGSDSPVQTDAPRSTPEQLEFFEKKVRPLLADHCWECHGPDAQEANLRLDSRAAALRGGDTGPAVVPGRPDRSEMILAIGYDPDGYQMPPTGKLPAEAIATLTEWVRMGAPWPDSAPAAGAETPGEFDIAQRAEHWSFQPVERPAVPDAGRDDWPASPIDTFIRSRLEEAGLSPAVPADRRTWLRRVTFDLIGLPPTPEETVEFLADRSPDAEHRVVDRLLASPHHGERWGRHWLDLVRYAETAGHEFDYDIPYAWRYRDYVVRALNADLPYDDFVIEHVAGDLLEAPRRHPSEGWNESILATGFWWLNQGKHSPVDVRAEECDRFDNQIDVLGKAFLGVTIACARCHDHKFDPISTADYYALAGYLQSTRRQMAFIDDERIHAAASRLDALQQDHRELIKDAVCGAVVDEPGAGLFANSRTGSDSADPFRTWRELHEQDDPSAFARVRRKLIAGQQQRVASNAAPDGLEVFEDFEASGVGFRQQDGRVVDERVPTAAGDARTWYATGVAFGAGPTSAGDFVLAASEAAAERFVLPEILPRGIAHSGRLSPRFRGTLRSETFTITKPFIDYRVQRAGGSANPGRKHKNGQIHLIVDGFHLIQQPLYGGLSINTANDGEFHWYRQDVSKLVGSRGYIELEDEEPDGWIAVDQIVLTDGARLAEVPSALLLNEFADPSIDSREAFVRRCAELIKSTAALWRRGELAGAPQANDRVAILNAVLQQRREIELAELPQPACDRLQTFLAAWSAADEAFVPSRRAIAAVDGSPEDEHVLIRGNHRKPGPQVDRRFLEVFAQPQLVSLLPPAESRMADGSGRLELARVMADPDNPLMSRVLVNRLWHQHFGRGLVATVDNFGVLGEPPSHAELLDWLAAEFVHGGARLKRMHRMMVLSATYRQTSSAGSRSAAVDPENRLWHSRPVQRLEAEAIRDAILAVSGRLDRRLAGESVPPYLTAFMEGRGRPAVSGPLDGDGRRSLYINVRRNFLSPLFLAFDYPNPLSTMGRRSVSNVPAQALALMNNPLVHQQAELWAERTIREAGPDAPAESIVRQLYEAAFTRPPSPGELEAALAYVEAVDGSGDATQRWADLCHVLLNAKEFIFIP